MSYYYDLLSLQIKILFKTTLILIKYNVADRNPNLIKYYHFSTFLWILKYLFLYNYLYFLKALLF